MSENAQPNYSVQQRTCLLSKKLVEAVAGAEFRFARLLFAFLQKTADETRDKTDQLIVTPEFHSHMVLTICTYRLIHYDSTWITTASNVQAKKGVLKHK